MKRIRQSRQADVDLIQIYQYLNERSPDAADRVFNAIERSIESLLTSPGMGRRWESADPRLAGMRVVPVTPYRNYLLFFQPVASGIDLLRVVHGARELERIVDEIDIDFDET